MAMRPDDIELAARTMTEAEPPADLELRIKRRLDEVTTDARVRRRSVYWLVPAGVAVALVAVLLVPRFRTADVPVVVDVPQSTNAAVVEATEDTTTEVMDDGPAPAGRVFRLPAYRSISEAELAWMSRSVPALDVINPIQPGPVSITPLIMTPLVTSPMYGDPDEGWK